MVVHKLVVSMKQRSFLWLFFGLAIFGFFADQMSKYKVFNWLAGSGHGSEYDVVPGWFKLIAQTDPTVAPCDCAFVKMNGPVHPRVNRGALFGLGDEQKHNANLFFMSISILAAIAILIWATRQRTRSDLLLTVALGLILSGTLGNLFDRIVFGGVRDFLYFYYIEWPVFNIADCALVCGAGLLLFQAIFLQPTDNPKSSPTPTQPLEVVQS
jgi:signal peptidase II